MAEAPKVLFLIDISSYFYRAFHAIRGLATSQGFPTNAAYGVTNMLLKVIKDRQPRYLALIRDAKGPTFRHRLYSEYKAHRPPMPEELVMQLPYISKIIEAFNFPSLEQEGFEADDLIACLVEKARAQGFEVEIISGDKDLLALVADGVHMWDPMKDVRYDLAAVQEKYGLPPQALVEVKALAGDPSDNIPGVPGIGEKTALKLISRFHSLENLLAHLDEVKEKALRARLEEHAAQARLSRKLAELNPRVPLGVDMETLHPGPPDREALRRIFLELEFSSLSKELGADLKPAGDFFLARTQSDLDRVAAAVRASGELALHFLYSEQHPVMARMAGLGVAWAPGQAAYIPFGEGADKNLIQEKLAPLLAQETIRKLGPDLKAALQLARRCGWEMAGLAGDMLLASYLLNPARYEQNLENVARHHLGVNLPGVRELAGRPLALVELPEDLALAYAAGRAEICLRLWPGLKEGLKRDGLWDLYAALELPLLSTLAAMESRGILLDQDFLKRLGADLERDLARLEREIHDLAGEPFLIQSPQQLGRILFTKLNIAPQKKTKGKTGYSTDSEVLQTLEHPIAKKVLEYRSLGKLKATYVDALLKLVDPDTGRVHTTFIQSVAATGRLSSRDPNLQNIPVRGEVGGQIRQAFVAPPGQVFLSADYSQMELRLLAHYSKDPALLKAFRDGVDIHRQTAAVVFNIHPELVTSDMRRTAKVINFGIIYGMSAFGLAKQLGVGNRMAQDFIQRYFARHPGVKAYLEETVARARQEGWVSTLLGRRRQIPQINSTNRIVRQEAERSAINTPLQGTAADIIKKAMIEVEPALSGAGLAARMLLQLHDELIFELPASELIPTGRIVRQVMQQAVEMTVPLVVELRAGQNWGEMSPLKKPDAA